MDHISIITGLVGTVCAIIFGYIAFRRNETTDKEVVWFSADTSIATIDAEGVIHPKREGEVLITAISVAGGKSAEYSVKVIPSVFVEEILVSPVYLSENTRLLEVTTFPEYATGEISFSSSDPTVATVDSDGVVTRLQTEETDSLATMARSRMAIDPQANSTCTFCIIPNVLVEEVLDYYGEKTEELVVGEEKKEGMFTFIKIILREIEDCLTEAQLKIEEIFGGSTEEEFEKEDNTTPKYVRIMGNYVYARNSPTTADDTNKILHLESDTYLKYLYEVLDENSIPWYQVQLFDGITAYVCSKYYDITEEKWIILACVEEEVSANTVIDAQGNILYYHCAFPKNFKEYRMMVNALYIYDNLIAQSREKKFTDLGEEIIIPKWTPNAIYGLLGNLAVESRMNPENWENGENATTGGFGLTQWTPPEHPDKYICWVREVHKDENPDNSLWNMDWQLDRIRYEVYWDMQKPNNGQWHSSAYGAGMTFNQYIQSNIDAADLGEAFLRGYEKPKVLIEGPDDKRQKTITTRRRLADNWKEFFESNKQILYVHEVE